jgi:hypothetical protein
MRLTRFEVLILLVVIGTLISNAVDAFSVFYRIREQWLSVFSWPSWSLTIDCISRFKKMTEPIEIFSLVWSNELETKAQC